MATLVTVAQLKAYARKQDGDTAGEALYSMYLGAAERVVQDYLGYAPASASYSHTFYGDGKSYLALRAPIITLSSVTVAGVSKTASDYLVDGETITHKSGEVFPAGSSVVVGYTGGFSSVPDIILLTILRIASLMCVEAGEAIGMTSQSFDGGSTRSFLNYTNYAKYLSPLASLRIVRLERMAP